MGLSTSKNQLNNSCDSSVLSGLLFNFNYISALQVFPSFEGTRLFGGYNKPLRFLNRRLIIFNMESSLRLNRLPQLEHQSRVRQSRASLGLFVRKTLNETTTVVGNSEVNEFFRGRSVVTSGKSLNYCAQMGLYKSNIVKNVKEVSKSIKIIDSPVEYRDKRVQRVVPYNFEFYIKNKRIDLDLLFANLNLIVESYRRVLLRDLIAYGDAYTTYMTNSDKMYGKWCDVLKRYSLLEERISMYRKSKMKYKAQMGLFDSINKASNLADKTEDFMQNATQTSDELRATMKVATDKMNSLNIDNINHFTNFLRNIADKFQFFFKENLLDTILLSLNKVYLFLATIYKRSGVDLVVSSFYNMVGGLVPPTQIIDSIKSLISGLTRAMKGVGGGFVAQASHDTPHVTDGFLMSIINAIKYVFSSLFGSIGDFSGFEFSVRKISCLAILLRSCSTIFDFVVSILDFVFNKVIKFITKTVGFVPKVLIPENLTDLYNELDAIEKEDVVTKSLLTLSNAKRIIQFRDRVNTFLFTEKPKNVNKLLMVHVNYMKRMADKWVEAIPPYLKDVPGSDRQKPVWIYIYGKPRIGKTSVIAKTLVYACAGAMNLIDQEEKWDAFVFNRNLGDPYWEGYNGHPVVSYTDILQEVMDERKIDLSITELTRINDGNAYMLPMAFDGAKGKGKNYFTSKLIVSDAQAEMNISNFTNRCWSKGQHIFARRTIVLEVILNDKYALEGSVGIDYNKFDDAYANGNFVHNALEPVAPKDAYIFKIHDNVNNSKVIREFTDFETAVNWIKNVCVSATQVENVQSESVKGFCSKFFKSQGEHLESDSDCEFQQAIDGHVWTCDCYDLDMVLSVIKVYGYTCTDHKCFRSVDEIHQYYTNLVKPKKTVVSELRKWLDSFKLLMTCKTSELYEWYDKKKSELAAFEAMNPWFTCLKAFAIGFSSYMLVFYVLKKTVFKSTFEDQARKRDFALYAALQTGPNLFSVDFTDETRMRLQIKWPFLAQFKTENMPSEEYLKHIEEAYLKYLAAESSEPQSAEKKERSIKVQKRQRHVKGSVQAEAQMGLQDETDFLNSVKNSMCRIVYKFENADSTRSVGNDSALNIGGDVFVLPRHYWRRLKQYIHLGCKIKIMLYWPSKDNKRCTEVYPDCIEEFPEDKMWTHSEDVSYIRIKNLYCGKDLRRKFASIKDNPNLYDAKLFGIRGLGHSCDGCNVIYSGDKLSIEVLPLSRVTFESTLETMEPEYLLAHPVSYSSEGAKVHNVEIPPEEHELSSCYMYTNCPTIAGDCGMLLIHSDPHYAGKILGMHVAGHVKSNSGIGCPIFQEDVDDVLTYFRAPIRREDSIYTNSEMPKSGFAAQAASLDLLVEGSLRNFVKNGKLQSYKVNMPNRTKISQSVAFDLMEEDLGPHKFEPAKLNKGVVDGVEMSPMLMALKKNINYTNIVRQSEFDQIVEHVSNSIENWHSKWSGEERRILTYHEALNGIDGLRQMDMSTSAGFPFVKLASASNKNPWVDCETLDNGQKIYSLTPEMLEFCEKRLQDAKANVITPTFFIDTLKDETRPLEKVKMFKTRLFQVGPFDLSILMRRYMGAFVRHMMNVSLVGECGLGINPESLEWSILIKRLKKHGLGFICGDYSNYDASINMQIAYFVAKVINMWYNDGEENFRIRLIFVLSCFSGYHIVDLLVYLFVGNPSGNFLTTIINVLGNMFFFRLVYLRRVESDLTNFERYVCATFWGDDNLAAIASKIAHLFNMKTMQEELATLNVVYTTADKSSIVKELYDISEITYLKRTWKFNEEHNFYFAPLDLDTILETARWSAGDPLNVGDQMARFNSTLLFASAHSLFLFNRLKSLFVEYCHFFQRGGLEVDGRVVSLPYNANLLFSYNKCLEIMYPDVFKPDLDLALCLGKKHEVLRGLELV